MKYITPPEMKPGDVIEFVDGFQNRLTVIRTEDPANDPALEPDQDPGVVWKIHGRDSRGGAPTWFYCGCKSEHLLYHSDS
jgi:hypothetical protein